MSPEILIELCQQAFILAILLALPPLAATFFLSILLGLLQSATGIQDASIGAAPRIVVALLVFAATLPWVLTTLMDFVETVMTAIRSV